MKRILYFCIIWGIGIISAYGQPFPNPAIDVQQYTFALEINDQNAEIKGEATVSVRFAKDGVKTFLLDLVNQSSATVKKGMKVTAITLDSTALTFTHRMNQLEIQLPEAPAAESVKSFVIRYGGIPADGLIISENLYGNKTFFGDNWPNRAHHWLPVVDHPLDKAKVSFAITAPQKYQVIANGALVEETDLSNGKRLTRWENKVPLPTKVMVFGAAEFAVEYVGDLHNIPVSTWVYPQNREAGFYDFALALQVFTFMEKYVGPYPFEKLANVQSTTRYGGMENASNIFYAETAITGERSSEELIAHEIAHQWFGNSASEASWYHIWLSEGFATYLKHLYMEAIYGEKRLAEGMAVDRESIFQTGPDLPVVNENITNLNQLLNTNSYEKGGWILHMLRKEVGDEMFHKGIRTYYEKYKLSNALTDDFRKVMEEVSGKDLKLFFDQWLFRAGHPRLKMEWKYDGKKKKLRVTVSQTQEGESFVFPLELEIRSKNTTESEIIEMPISQKEETFEIGIKTEPAEVIMDPGVRLLFKETK
ncbi:MAG: M1 family aminopeptidase [Bacteroidia bacterium]|nr:M1 family aminopeptidase [Bacteroidia bacterium]